MKRTASDLEAVASSVVKKSRPFQILAVLAAGCFAAGGGLALYGSKYVGADAYADQMKTVNADILQLKLSETAHAKDISYIKARVDETSADVKTLLRRR